MAKSFVAGLALGLGLLAACQEDAMAPSDRAALSAGAEVWQSAAGVTPTTVHGVNFLIKSQIDPNFCVQVDNGTTEGRSLTLQVCSGADTERWALPWNSDDTNPLVDSQGMCVDGHFARATPGATLTVARCQSGDNWRFTVTSAGLLQNVKNHMCLSVPGAASNAQVTLVDCDATKQGQLWQFAH